MASALSTSEHVVVVTDRTFLSLPSSLLSPLRLVLRRESKSRNEVDEARQSRYLADRYKIKAGTSATLYSLE